MATTTIGLMSRRMFSVLVSVFIIHDRRVHFFTAREYRLPHLEPNAKYKVRVQAKNEAGMSEMSEYFDLSTSESWGLFFFVMILLLNVFSCFFSTRKANKCANRMLASLSSRMDGTEQSWLTDHRLFVDGATVYW